VEVEAGGSASIAVSRYVFPHPAAAFDSLDSQGVKTLIVGCAVAFGLDHKFGTTGMAAQSGLS